MLGQSAGHLIITNRKLAEVAAAGDFDEAVMSLVTLATAKDAARLLIVTKSLTIAAQHTTASSSELRYLVVRLPHNRKMLFT
jgi:hypothetical protein